MRSFYLKQLYNKLDKGNKKALLERWDLSKDFMTYIPDYMVESIIKDLEKCFTPDIIRDTKIHCILN